MPAGRLSTTFDNRSTFANIVQQQQLLLLLVLAWPNVKSIIDLIHEMGTRLNFRPNFCRQPVRVVVKRSVNSVAPI